jgi:hypothetical protein
VEDVLLTKP